VNFIVKLSKFKKSITEFEYDSIMIIVNRFTKWAYFVSFHEKMRVKKIVYLFKWHIITNHEVLTEIILNRDTRFRSKFWQTLITLKEMKTKMSTTEHSQMNDQTEWLNQIMKQYLRCYVNYQQNNWVELLFTA